MVEYGIAAGGVGGGAGGGAGSGFGSMSLSLDNPAVLGAILVVGAVLLVLFIAK